MVWSHSFNALAPLSHQNSEIKMQVADMWQKVRLERIVRLFVEKYI
jgi:hypothetical protein